jgi:hypothetical protein
MRYGGTVPALVVGCVAPEVAFPVVNPPSNNNAIPPTRKVRRYAIVENITLACLMVGLFKGCSFLKIIPTEPIQRTGFIGLGKCRNPVGKPACRNHGAIGAYIGTESHGKLNPSRLLR